MSDLNDPQALTAVRWNFVKIFLFFLSYLVVFLVFLASLIEFLKSPPKNLLEFGGFPIFIMGILLPIVGWLQMACFLGKIWFGGYTIYISADYRTVCDTDGNFYIAGMHKPIRIEGRPYLEMAAFPEYGRRAGPSAPAVVIRPGTFPVWRAVFGRFTARYLWLPLCFACQRGRIVRGLRSVRA